MKYSIGICFLISILFLITHAEQEKYVKIGLKAKWRDTSPLMEISEFMASESGKQFWEFLGKLKDVDIADDSTQKETYNAGMKVAATMLTSTELDALRFSLSLRTLSPKVQFFHELSLETAAHCNPFVMLGDGSILCDVKEAADKIDSINQNSKSLQSFDHVYPNSADADALPFVLHADIASSSFKLAYQSFQEVCNGAKLKCAFRHFIKESDTRKPLQLSGYGVELAVKNTEYKNVDDQKTGDNSGESASVTEEEKRTDIDGFLFNRLREIHPQLKDELVQLEKHLKDSQKELAELKVWQLQDISYQAAQRVMSSPKEDQLQELKDTSQNAPMVARSLVKTKVNSDMRSEIQANQKRFEGQGIPTGGSTLIINGIQFQEEDLDIFKIVDLMKKETLALSALSGLKLDKNKVGDLLSLNVKPESDDIIVDTRSESVQWINDLENDQQYAYWPGRLEEILRPTFPGMLRYIGKNIFHVIAYLNPIDNASIKLFLHLNDMVDASIPARFGVLFVADGSPQDKPERNVAAGIVRAFSFISADKDRKEAFKFLKNVYNAAKKGIHSMSVEDITIELVKEQFLKLYAVDELENLAAGSEYDDLRRLSCQVFDGLGLKTSPSLLVNGIPVPSNQLDDHLDSTITEMILEQTGPIQQGVYMGRTRAYPNIYDYVMSSPNVVRRINKLIQTTKGTFLSIEPSIKVDERSISDMNQPEAVGILMQQANYFIKDDGVATIWVFADANSIDGRLLLKNALSDVINLKSSRLAVFINSRPSLNEHKILDTNTLVEIILDLRTKLISGVAKLLERILSSPDLDDLLSQPSALLELANGVTGINKKKLLEQLQSDLKIKEAYSKLDNDRIMITKATGVNAGENFVVLNGRVIGPLKGTDIVVAADFDLMQNFENDRCGFKISEVVSGMNIPDLPSEGIERYKSDLVFLIAKALNSRSDETKRISLSYQGDQHSVIDLPPRNSKEISYSVDAVMDPLSNVAQKMSPILKVLHEAFNIRLRIFFNCKEKLSEMPVKRFYQYVLQPELIFDEKEDIKPTQNALFFKLPESALLTINMDTPQNWMIEACGANMDLDNIHLGDASKVVYGYYELANIIVEGHASDVTTHSPPRGLQIVLGNKADPLMFDTIVMANLGYFQLKANPGLYTLQLRGGRSSEVYSIDSLDGGEEAVKGKNYSIFVDSFAGKFLKVKVARNPGHESTDILSGDDQEESGIWNSISSFVGKDSSSKGNDGKIHIFSVATGLLYERFLRIMMLSVLRHTKTPVKFWFLKNYLSSECIEFLPTYSKKYGFEYELVTYQWPQWLHRQTEKQRIIWGYKILFLDVLFPLDLNRVIFVDADQIVRSDLKELMEMDLGGAPYAYTPFCMDRKDMDGFRFWMQGYWKSHLAGRAYHISALYVIDLKRFRKVAAGDRLRGQYQGLSQDPNSLANLDQDLPNNMIHQVQIKSLPQEWLWCETWCSNESKQYAKTIDMCNNPQTKEPKLERAMRIAPEWKEYDDELRKVMDSMHKDSATDKNTSDDKMSQRQEL